MSVKSCSPAQLALARKAGFRKKKPKKPKRSASLATMQNYVSRYNGWMAEMRSKISDYKKREALKKRIF